MSLAIAFSPKADTALGTEVPPWVFSILGLSPASSPYEPAGEGFLLRQLVGPQSTLWSLRIEGAVGMDAATFENACADAYRIVGRRVAASERPYAVRWWNFIPGILEPLGQLEHRYMVFNAGRFQALATAGSNGFGRLATASGVGHGGADFVLHGLTRAESGRQIENPRQVPAWRYSQRFGPKPPCFARATRIERDARHLLLVGGTASVCGEDSCHRDDLLGQLEETLRNLAALVLAAENPEGGSAAPKTEKLAELGAEELADALLAYRELRVYYPCPEHGVKLEAELRRRLGSAPGIEMVPAALCRPELLVEIEGLAELRG